MNRRVTALSRAAVLAAALGSLTAVQAADFKVSEALKTLTFGGDVRLRQEYFDKTTRGMIDRSRQRFRLRLATEAELPENVKVKLRFASGTGEQTSTNQSLDNASSQKAFWIDRAYLEWKPVKWARLQGGRQANPLWTTYTSDVVWDDDLNPEGFGQSFEALMPGNMRLFANSLQMIGDEDDTSTADQWLLSNQVGADFLIGESRWKSALAYHHFENSRINSLSQVAVAEGNRRIAAGPSAGALANNFGVVEFTTELLFPVFDTTLTPGGTYIKNFAAQHQQRVGHRLGDTGYQVGARLGKAAAEKTWEAAYYYKWVEVDATLADFADSDFGDGGVNRQGHIGWVAYNPREWLQIKFKSFFTRVINDAEPPNRDHINRYQLDLSVKF
ncbi:MAG: hypothetical protein FD126_1425 [Elusimicrobia bacterium]|nr:MAG: hypothetical protein FD126_1425 [Elusimicrobiota bacterium]